jgi:hypothetical protein
MMVKTRGQRKRQREEVRQRDTKLARGIAMQVPLHINYVNYQKTLYAILNPNMIQDCSIIVDSYLDSFEESLSAKDKLKYKWISENALEPFIEWSQTGDYKWRDKQESLQFLFLDVITGDLSSLPVDTRVEFNKLFA